MLYFAEEGLIFRYKILAGKIVNVLEKIKKDKVLTLTLAEKAAIKRGVNLIDKIYRASIICDGGRPKKEEGITEGMLLCGYTFLAINKIRQENQNTYSYPNNYTSFLKEALTTLRNIEKKKKPYTLSINITKSFFVFFLRH